MPIYEYQCQQCRHRLEKLQKMSDDPLTKCPECGEESLKKLVSAAAFRLKGGGWYETDFKKDGKRNLAGDSGKDSDKSASKETNSSAESSSGKSASSDSASTPASKSADKSADKATAKPAAASPTTKKSN